MKDASELILATDPDREGESISWHLKELLKPKVKVRRIVFHEITEEAVKAALAEAHDVDENLVRAQESRRILDRLYGYTLSPVLWKKVQTGLSAGRVQSVAVRVIVEREEERIAFRTASYWDLEAKLRGGVDRVRRDAREGRRPARRHRQGFRQQGPARIQERPAARREDRAGVPRRPDAPPAVEGDERRGKALHAAARAAVHDLDAAAGSQPQAGLLVRADDADCAAAVPGHGPRRRRARGFDFVSPHRFDHAQLEGADRSRSRGEGAVRRRLSQGPAAVSDQGPQRAGSARGDSPHAFPSHARVAREDSRERRDEDLRADLEARRGVADGRREAAAHVGRDHRRSRQRRAGGVQRERQGDRVCRLPARLRRRLRRSVGRAARARHRAAEVVGRRRGVVARQDGSGSDPARAGCEGAPDLAARALHRSVARQAPGRRRHRPAVDLRADGGDHSAPRLHLAPGQGAGAELYRVCRHAPAAQPLRRLRRHRVHRRDGRDPRQDLQRREGLARVPRRVLSRRRQAPGPRAPGRRQGPGDRIPDDRARQGSGQRLARARPHRPLRSVPAARARRPTTVRARRCRKIWRRPISRSRRRSRCCTRRRRGRSRSASTPPPASMST